MRKVQKENRKNAHHTKNQVCIAPVTILTQIRDNAQKNIVSSIEDYLVFSVFEGSI